jgi:LmbE family N-acetylglucosaminyl deacetylase
MPGLLVLLAHPDDEIFCGGLLAALGKRGVPVHLVYWTRGEGGGSPKRRLWWRCHPANWQPRVREARRSARALGAASVDFLGGIDPAPDPGPRAPSGDEAAWVAKISQLIRRYRPKMVLTHGSQGDYGHPAHVRLHEIGRKVAAAHPEVSLLSFNAAWPEAPKAVFLNAADPADFLFDSGPYLREKIGIIRTHRSQQAVLPQLSSRRSLRDFFKLGRYEGYHCWTEGEAKARTLETLGQWSGPGAV